MEINLRGRFFSLPLILAGILLHPPVSGADLVCPQGPVTAGWVDTPGVAWSMVVEGTHAYVGDGPAGLQVLDLSQPGNPQIVGTWESSPGFVYFDIAAQGNLVYCGLKDYGLGIIDVSNPAVPVLRDSLALPGETQGVAVSGTTVFLAGVDQGFHVVDVSDPDSASLVMTYSTPGDAWDVAVEGNRLYVTEYGFRLSIFDVSTPASPMELGAYIYSGAYVLAVEGSLVYMADGTYLTILDVSNPASPMLVSQTPILGATGIVVSNGYVYLSTDNPSVALEIYDVTVPSAPVVVSRVVQGAVYWPGVAVYGDHVYVTSQTDGILVVDATHKDRFDPVGVWSPPTDQGPKSVRDVSVDVDMAVCIVGPANGPEGGDLEVLDVSTPSAPVSLSAITPVGAYYGVELRGSHAYAVSLDTTMAVIDLTVPTMPNIVAAVDSGRGNALAVEGTTAYVAGEAGFYVVDVGDPQNPAVIGSYMDTWIPTATDIVVEGGLAYLVSNHGFEILDVSDPGAPSWVSRTNFTYFYLGAEGALNGNYLYLSPDEVYDVSNPVSPQLVAGFRGLSAAGRIVVGDRVYLAGFSAGFYIQDASDPADPQHVGTVAAPGNAQRIREAGGYLYLADGEAGLRIYGDPCTVVSVELAYFTAAWEGEAAVLEWETVEPGLVSFHVYREDGDGNWIRLTASPVTGVQEFSYRDPAPPRDGARYRLEEIGRDGVSEWHDPVTLPPAGFVSRLTVSPGVPTPFSSRVQLGFASPRNGRVVVRILDIQGRVVNTVLDRELPAGPHELEWTGLDRMGRPVPAGIYFYRVDAGGETLTRRLVRLGR